MVERLERRDLLNGDPPFKTGVVFYDVNGDLIVSPQDVLLLIHKINRDGSGVFNPLQQGQPVGWYDVNGDGFTSPYDCLLVIEYLNRNGAGPAPQPVVTNLPPVAYDMALSVMEGEEIAFHPAVIDPEQQPLSFQVANPPDWGTLSTEDGETFTYMPDPGFVGSDTLRLLATDAVGQTAMSMVTVTVLLGPGPHAPVALDDSFAVAPGTPVTFDVTANDIEFDGEPLTITRFTSPDHGVLVLNGGNTMTYTPDAAHPGYDEFVYEVRDSSGLTDTANVGLVLRVNHLPVVQNPTVNVTVNTPSALLAVPQLAVDPDGDPMSVSFSDPDHGAIAVSGQGWVYTPDTGFVGADAVEYSVGDGFGVTSGTVLFVVSEPHFLGPGARRDEAVYVGVELNGGVLSAHSVQHFADVPQDNWAFSFVEEALSEGWLNGGFAVGPNFYPPRNVTYGEMAVLVGNTFGFVGDDPFVAAAAHGVLRGAEIDDLAAQVSAARFWQMWAAADHANGASLSEIELDVLARGIASQFGAAY